MGAALGAVMGAQHPPSVVPLLLGGTRGVIVNKATSQSQIHNALLMGLMGHIWWLCQRACTALPRCTRAWLQPPHLTC